MVVAVHVTEIQRLMIIAADIHEKNIVHNVDDHQKDSPPSTP